MALIACGDCGKQISDKAGKCPHCGLPLPDIAPLKRDWTPEPKTSPWAWWALGIGGGSLVLMMIVAAGMDRKPTVEALKESCAREFPGNQSLANDCVIKNAVKIIGDDRQERLDRARSSVR
jgi:hypothetical protein